MAKKEETSTLMLQEGVEFYLFGKNCLPLTNEMLQDADIAEFVARKITDEEKIEFFV
jgi:hypothetical protein